MPRSEIASVRLVSTTAIAWALLASAAFAQSQAQPNDTSGVEEVVVTATRQESTVNRVPLSISAVTQRSLDQQGIKDVADLSRSVPALNVTGQQGGVATFAIRGIVSTQGAATTGVYLDDTALQKRNTAGASFQTAANGTPGPVLFDLERVEVLRGPQGTLYGGSSQGGTIRFITPTPSLTRYSGYARAETAKVYEGGWSYEGGVAVGGPIVQDKLGARVSVYHRKNAGYIDFLDPYQGGAVRFKNANELDVTALRASILWAPTERSTVNLAYYHSESDDAGGGAAFNLPLGAVTTPERCFNGSTTVVPCTTPGAYRRPTVTYGPFNYIDEYDRVDARELSPALTFLDVGTLTLGYDFGTMDVKAITSYIHDKTKNVNPELPQIANFQQTTAFPNANGFSLFSLWPDYNGFFINSNNRYGFSEEIRFSSGGEGQRLSWVAGAYYSNIRAHSQYSLIEDMERITRLLYGISAQQRYGFPQNAGNLASFRDQTLKDIEVAAFGEANYRILPDLTATAGIRLSRVTFEYRQILYGILNGWPVPTEANTGIVGGSVSESPVTPKFGLQYNFNPDDMVYANAAKGFRPGGVNSPLSNVCGPGLALVGLTLADVPRTYGSDTVWSYEAGGKFRTFGNRLQVNASVYRIDWSGVQLNVSTPGCGQVYVQNAGKARSQGFDFTAQGRVFGGLTANLAIGYNDAEYTTNATGPRPLNGSAPALIVQTGDKLPVPPVTVSVGAQYDWRMSERLGAYLRADLQYASPYYRSLGPGVNAYTPDTRGADDTFYVNVRAGVTMNSLEINVFARNLTNSKDELTRAGGRSGCSLAQGAACTTFSNYNPFTQIGTFRPREIGVQLSYRY